MGMDGGIGGRLLGLERCFVNLCSSNRSMIDDNTSGKKNARSDDDGGEKLDFRNWDIAIFCSIEISPLFRVLILVTYFLVYDTIFCFFFWPESL